LLYGSTPLEDIIGYNQVVRSLTEWSGNNPDGVVTQSSINEGVGSFAPGVSGGINPAAGSTSGATRTAYLPGLVNVRQAMIQGVSTIYSAFGGTYPAPATGQGFGVVPAGTLAVSPGLSVNSNIKDTNPVRRYQVNLALGLFNQPKLIPTKFMASQLAIEITLSNASECLFVQNGSFVTPSYQISNVNLIPEILEFDASYGKLLSHYPF